MLKSIRETAEHEYAHDLDDKKSGKIQNKMPNNQGLQNFQFTSL